MKYLLRLTCQYLVLLTFSFFTFTNFAFAENFEQSTAKDAFSSINKALYTIEETRNYCSSHFSSMQERNAEAFQQWELQYSFFLREFDKNYAKWKSGFTTLEQQQFASLEFIDHQLIQKEIEIEYKEGGEDKCYNFKPSLMRPRNNLEVTYQEDFNLIRNQSLNGFIDARNEGTGAHSLCTWQQDKAIEISTFRNEGKDIKFQKNQLKELKKLAPSDIDKKEQASRIKNYDSMINDAYKLTDLQTLSFSQYQFASCERELNKIESDNLKKSLPLMLECQNKNAEYSDLLGLCINQALDKK